jgi:uncharacterized membrane protein
MCPKRQLPGVVLADGLAKRDDMATVPRRILPLSPGVLLGIGLGGFIDGIVLHQILQWHHMVTSAGYPPNSVQNLTINTLFDGLFHAATWIATAVGLFLLHRAVRGGYAWSGYRLLGGMAIGWGAFNLVEGVVDHHLLGIHHVKETAANPLLWDLGFLALGAVLVIVGVSLSRTALRRAEFARDIRRAA